MSTKKPETFAVGANALVEFEEDEKVTKGGIVLPDSATRDVRWAKLLSMGQVMTTDGYSTVTYTKDLEQDVDGWNVGDRVLVRGPGLALAELGERVAVIRAEQILVVQPIMDPEAT
ncbi:MAG: co-chaperone GroES family protein [Chloroflexota bacterium]